MPNTHCLPTGSLGTNELPVPPIPGLNTINTPGALGSNLIRGIVIICHGLNDNNNTFPDIPLAFLTSLVADGWITYNTLFQEDLTNLNDPSTAVFNDVNSDTGHGSRYLTSWLHTWDHIVIWVHQTYAVNLPIVVLGFSWGGWHALQIAANKQSTIISYVAHCPLQFLTNAATSATPGSNWTTLTSTGADISNTGLNGVSIPGIVGWSNPDTTAKSYTIQTPCDAAIALSQPLTEYATATGHGWPTAASTRFLSYFTATIDPLAPKAF